MSCGQRATAAQRGGRRPRKVATRTAATTAAARATTIPTRIQSSRAPVRAGCVATGGFGCGAAGGSTITGGGGSVPPARLGAVRMTVVVAAACVPADGEPDAVLVVRAVG